MRVLVVEDDLEAQRYLVKGLKEAGHVVDDAGDGETGLTLALSRPYDVAVVDRMLPRLDGLKLVAEMREERNMTPVLFLSALSDVDDRIKGLRAGGDDYLTKPYAFAELLARLDALVRRRDPGSVKTKVAVGDLELDLLSRTAKRNGSAIELQPREFRLLEYLMRHAGQIVTRTMLLENVWEYHFDPQTNVIDVHISRLRAKIDKGFEAPLLHTVRGAGYMIRAHAYILRTQAFRIVAIYLAIFAVSAVALVGFVYWNTARVLDRETDETIEAEITGLVEQYSSLGLPGLTDAIIGRSIRREQGLYLLANSDRRVIAGSLDGWPGVTPTAGGFVEFPYERRVGTATEVRSARGKIITLAQGFYLLVARDVEERRVLESLFQTALFWGAGLMIVLGLAGGLLISRNFLARLDVINRTSRQIMGGELSRRVPVTTAGDEFDDLSDNLNRMLDRIERLLHGMREVSDNVAHDLRSPLNRLRNRLELAAMRQPPDTDTARDFDAAVQETDRLIGTFNALLLIAEAEAGSVRETMRDFSLSDIIEGVGELYGPLAEEKQLRFVVKKAPECGLIHGNHNLISQALANLVDNAIKYTPSGGAVLVALENHDAGPALVVADNGPGIPSEDRARVTERFVRLESSRNSPGTGLGLSLVAAVASMHEAGLSFEDNHPGLRVTLSFKRVAEEPRVVKTAHARAESVPEAVH